MKIKRIDFNQKAIVVMGAGATRGASFVNSKSSIQPPLDSDFFTQAQRLSSKKPKELVVDLIRNTVSIFGGNFDLTMENFLTHIEHLRNVFNDYKLQGHPSSNPYPGIRDQFLQVLAAVFDEAIGRHPDCEYHGHLVQNLSTEDVILSFNYDWLIDYTLKEHGYNKWNPRKGYGAKVYVSGKRGGGTEYWATKDSATRQGQYPDTSTTLLKMHGAMNWFPVSNNKDGKPGTLQLRKRWWHQLGKLKFEIAPPEWNKPIRSGIYREIWRRARKELREAHAVIFIGYSMPATDLSAQALFMVDAMISANPKMLNVLVIVNPDRSARERIRRVMRGRINETTRILTFDSLEQFTAFLE